MLLIFFNLVTPLVATRWALTLGRHRAAGQARSSFWLSAFSIPLSRSRSNIRGPCLAGFSSSNLLYSQLPHTPA
ncbi:hypothetical protein DFH29DRAFT_942975 [Suillus ampliporus]|nr:hypothetical protein DFH29DRAFT_942975 [Suillus ampliporus]